jgi:hypothetical protein
LKRLRAARRRFSAGICEQIPAGQSNFEKAGLPSNNRNTGGRKMPRRAPEKEKNDGMDF